jgi:hypothetical protein
MKKHLLNWLAVSSYSIQSLDQCITKCRRFIRFNTIISLAFSTVSGSLSITSYTKNNLVVNVLLTFCSFTVVIIGSIIKVYQYQERLENYIKIKQDWINFASGLSTELTLKREPYESIINNHKNKYNQLLQTDYEIFGDIKKNLKLNNDIETGIIPKSKGIRVHDILLHVAKNEEDVQENPEIETHSIK